MNLWEFLWTNINRQQAWKRTTLDAATVVVWALRISAKRIHSVAGAPSPRFRRTMDASIHKRVRASCRTAWLVAGASAVAAPSRVQCCHMYGHTWMLVREAYHSIIFVFITGDKSLLRERRKWELNKSQSTLSAWLHGFIFNSDFPFSGSRNWAMLPAQRGL